jgi:dihydrofolate reductase
MAKKIILYIAMSLDGYIAKPNDNLDFLEMVQQPNEDYGYSGFINSIDTIITGRKTYDWVMNMVKSYPNADKKTFVITRQKRESNGNLEFYSGDLKELVIRLKKENGKNIFCEGGADIVNELLYYKLIDECIISIIPIILGDGIRLFKRGFPEQKLELISSESFKSGLVQLHYRMIKNV